MLRMSRTALIEKLADAMEDGSDFRDMIMEGVKGLAHMTDNELISEHNSMFNEDVEIEECQHRADWHTIAAPDNQPGVLKVRCRYCDAKAWIKVEEVKLHW